MILLSYILGILLIFFIPQPFPRVILVSAFYKEFLKEQQITEDSKSILLFSIFTASTFTSMFCKWRHSSKLCCTRTWKL